MRLNAFLFLQTRVFQAATADPLENGPVLVAGFVSVPALAAVGRSVQKLYPTPAWNGIALELLGANREKYAKRCLSITRKVTEATSED